MQMSHARLPSETPRKCVVNSINGSYGAHQTGEASGHLYAQTASIYAVVLDKISESPASKMLIVEHLKSFPHAVPSSSCITSVSADSVLRSQKASSPDKPLKARESLSLGRSMVASRTYVVAGEVVYAGLSQHRVLFQFISM